MLDQISLNPAIRRVLQEQLDRVGVTFERQLASDLTAVNRLCLHVGAYRGKMLRPTLTLVSGMVAAGDPGDGSTLTDAHIRVAAVAEMIHMATLVHDDVLDDAEVRRRGATVNHLRGNETAVMLGDYLISSAFHLCSTIGDPSINLAFGEITNTLCAGELLQLHHREDWSLDEETYLEIIRRKTASLIGGCCRLGARLSRADQSTENALHDAGFRLGVAFQIQDDLLDLIGEETTVGKSVGRDLAKGKVTLPVLRFLSHASPVERGRALQALREGDACALGALVRSAGTIDSASDEARRFIDEARRCIARAPAGPARDFFDQIAMSMMQRRS